jgi:hypothetical protein
MSDDPVRISMSPQLSLIAHTAKICGNDSDCTVCDIHRDEAKFRESTKHAGLTHRSQIFSFSGLLFSFAPAQLSSLAQNSQFASGIALAALALAIMHADIESCQDPQPKNFIESDH